MKSKNFLLAMWALISLTSAIYAQQKYAVLIGGDPWAVDIPQTDKWNEGLGMGNYGYDEFWNDCYLFWEMLVIEKQYTDENVHVLFNTGNDFTFPNQDERYKASQYGLPKITDFSSSKYNIAQTFSSLAGVIDDDDFLFVWIMSHGGYQADENYGGTSFIYLYGYDPEYPEDGILHDYELRDMLNSITALKKVVFVQAPHSGGFIQKLQGANKIVFTSSQAQESAYKCDNATNNQTYFEENEILDNIVYGHGEFNFHLYSSLAGKTPGGYTNYNGLNLVTAPDLNSDNFKSVYEAVEWEMNQETSELETPVLSDFSDIYEFTEFIYPTILWTSPSNNETYKGLIGITQTYSIEDFVLTFHDQYSGKFLMVINNVLFVKSGMKA